MGLQLEGHSFYKSVLHARKLDLDDNRAVSYEDGEILTKTNNFPIFLECSSKSGENIEEIFVQITRTMMEKINLL